MRAVKLEVVLPTDGQLTLRVPPEIPAGPVEVVILSKDEPAPQQVLLRDFLAELASLPMSPRSAQEIEADIAAERNAWDE